MCPFCSPDWDILESEPELCWAAALPDCPFDLGRKPTPHLWNMIGNINVPQPYCEGNFVHGGDTQKIWIQKDVRLISVAFRRLQTILALWHEKHHYIPKWHWQQEQQYWIGPHWYSSLTVKYFVKIVTDQHSPTLEYLLIIQPPAYLGFSVLEIRSTSSFLLHLMSFSL